jgi:citrate lyase subunit beta/citryl-CoA lyase
MARRSVLFSPGDQPELLRKAPGTGADVAVFDLEDAVAPSRKADARTAVRDVLADPEFDPNCEVWIRVNPVGASPDDDVEAVLSDAAAATADGVLLPKANDENDVRALDDILYEHDCSLPVMALVETAAGVLHAESIAAAEATDALLFGAEDLAADIGATRTSDGTEVLYARERVVLAASAAGVDAVDTVYTEIDDTDGLTEATRFAADIGYDGKMAIHPSQVGPINEAFTPSEEQIRWARRIVEAVESGDGGVVRVDGEMVDAPLVNQAERVLERARAADGVDPTA